MTQQLDRNISRSSLLSNTRHNGKRKGPYLFLGQQADVDASGTVRNPNDLLKQLNAVMTQIESAVEQLGGKKSDIVKMNVYYLARNQDDEEAILATLSRWIRCEVMPVVSLVALKRLPLNGLLITMDALAIDDDQTPRQGADIAPNSRLSSRYGFNQGIRCGELVLVAAQSATGPDANIMFHDDIASQAQRTIDNIQEVLASFDVEIDDVVKLNTWFVGQGTDEDWRRAARVRSEAFRYPGPAATGVPVPQPYPDGALVRQECWAMRGLDGSRLPRTLSWPQGHWDWPIPVSFQQGIKIRDWVFLGGQYACDVKGLAQAPNNAGVQTALTMDFIESILAQFELTLDNIVKTTCFYASPEEKTDTLDTILPIISSRFTTPAGPMSAASLATMGLEGLMLEIDSIAYAGD